eukprot:730797-Pyramimonas_sp.AAC.1
MVQRVALSTRAHAVSEVSSIARARLGLNRIRGARQKKELLLASVLCPCTYNYEQGQRWLAYRARAQACSQNESPPLAADPL